MVVRPVVVHRHYSPVSGKDHAAAAGGQGGEVGWRVGAFRLALIPGANGADKAIMAFLVLIFIWVMSAMQDAFELCNSIANELGGTCV